MDNPISARLFAKAGRLMPGGVNSPVRAYGSVGMNPLFIKKARGCRITDVDGHDYLDYVGSWGPLILGHAHPDVLSAIDEAVRDGTSFGAPTEREIILAELICEALPSVEMVRMVNSGTEAVMSALRLARGFTGRKKILKFAGCYHGHSDALLVKAGSGLLTLGTPDSAGVTEESAAGTVTAPYNDLNYVADVFKKIGSELAAVIVEPVAGNMGVVGPEPEFLRLLRQLTEKYGAVFIFDEVITGFRVSYGGAQGYYGIHPDLTVLGKIIGGGLPVGAYGGKSEIMRRVAPLGPVYQAGTLSGNPVAMAAGIATLRTLKANPGIYSALAEKTRLLAEAFLRAARVNGIPLTVNRLGSLLCPFFTGEKVTDYQSALRSDREMFARYFRLMLAKGIYLPPSQFEALFVSAAHTPADIERTVKAIEESFAEISEGLT
jgi:glutamate-1-semialdehyde 2,1-aminomutase